METRGLLQEKAEQERLFASFQKFVNLDGVDQQTGEEFQRFLKIFFQKTGQLWMPGACSLINLSRDVASCIAIDCFTKSTKVDSKTFKGIHFWLEITQVSISNIVVDPTGATYLGETLPYFGPLQNARDGVRNIYKEGTKA